jgi:hypothetical protein
LLRLGFVALIILCVTIQTGSALRCRSAADAAPDLTGGLELMGIQIDGITAGGALVGHSQACAEPIRAAVARTDGTDDETLGLSRYPDVRLKYIYLGSVEDRRNDSGIIMRWVLARALFVAGLTGFNPRRELVIVALPLRCPDLVKLDWAALSPGG